MERGKAGCSSPDLTEMSRTRSVCKWETAILKPDAAALPIRFELTLSTLS